MLSAYERIDNPRRGEVAGAKPAPEQAQGMFACVLITPYGIPEGERVELAEAVRARVARLTDRVAWLGRPGQSWPDGALLDLGRCAVSEAQEVCERLLAWLVARQFTARIGLGATQTLAHLAALVAAPGVVRVVAPESASTFLQRLPVEALEGLAEASVTPELVARLRRFGLRTLGQVAQLDTRDPQALRRQFGAAAGARLAAIAYGRDHGPLQPTPAPERVVVRLRFSAGALPDQALAALPRLAERLARRLAASERQGRTLRLLVVWASGAALSARRRLARPLHQPDELAQIAQALLITLLAPPDMAAGSEATEGTDAEGATPELITSLTLTLGDLAPWLPARQDTLFATPRATPAERSASQEPLEPLEPLERLAREVAEPLARRYGAPALYRLTTRQPDAILPEERTRLVGLTGAEQASSAASAHSQPRQPRGERLLEALGEDATSALPPQPHWW